MTDTPDDTTADAPDERTMRFLTATTEEQQALARDPAYEQTIVDLLGADGLAQFRSLPTADTGHLAAKPNPNTLFVPGVMGSVLSPLGLGGVWWLDIRARTRLDDLGLTPDGAGDAGGPFIDIQPVNVDLSYSEFMAMGLAHDWISIRGCPYDWRRRLSDEVDRLVGLVTGMRAANGGSPVHLVGHSMGGLLIRTALMERPELWDQIGKVVYIATPHFGSTSIAGYLKGHLWGTEAIAVLGLYLSRQTFQSLWGPLSLLPAPNGVYPGSTPSDHPCADFDLYRVESYELDFGRDAERATRLQHVLDHVADHWRRLHHDHRSWDADQLQRQLMIAGVGHESLFRLERDGAWFGLKDKKHRARKVGDVHREGDGRVPLASAVLPGVTTLYVDGEHGGLPNLPAVAATVFDWLTDQPDWSRRLSPTAVGALGGHLAGDEPASAPLLSSRAPTGLFDESTLLDDMTDDERQALRDLADTDIPGFNLTKIL